MRVHHALRRNQNRAMLRGEMRTPAKQQHVARRDFIECYFREMPARGVGKRFCFARFRPIGGIRRRQLRLVSDHFAPDAAQKAETIATGALARSLMPIRRADPAARGGNDLFLRGRQRSTPPS
jgi:hypothetical protein